MARNILHEYVNWTYNLSLYALSVGEYNANVTYGPTQNPGGTLLIASGGKQDGRNAHFKEDFFFDKMTMHGNAGLMEKSRNSNIMTIDFTLIEPMGVTLFNRLIAVAKDLGISSIQEMPYILKIEWRGYKIDGTPVKVPVTKILPIQFRLVKLKISQRGAQYDIHCIPYAHQIFDEAVASNPVRIEAQAPTVGEAFLSNIETDPPKRSDLLTQMPPSDVHVRSYTGALNKWYKTQASEKHAKFTDSVVFELDPKIAKAKLVDSKMITTQGMYFPKPGTPEAKQDCVTTNSRPKADLNANVTFQEGMAIHELLSAVIRESSYIGDNTKDEQKGEGSPGNGRMPWFKVKSRIEIGEWEPAFQRNVKKYIYRVEPYEIDNVTNRSFPLATMGTIPGPAKEYNYIFTGKNDDVIDLDLNFDAMWLTTITTNQENVSAVSGGQVTTPTLDPLAWPGALAQAAAFGSDFSGGSSHFASMVYPVATSTNAIKLLDGSRNEKARELQDTALSKAGGTMITIKLKIVGDPDFIKQDDFMFWGDKGATTQNGSITTDTGEVYIQVNVKTANDYDDQGLAIPGKGPYTMAGFSGMYSLLGVDCEFAQGKFTQTLTCNRFPAQPPAK